MSDEGVNDAVSATLVTRVAVPPELVQSLTGGLVKIMILGMDQQGFLSSEIVPPAATDPSWKLIQRFRDPQQLAACKNLEARHKLLSELSSSLGIERQAIIEEELTGSATNGTVATAIVTLVKPGMETVYRQWESKIQSAQAKRSGYQGSYVQPPTDGTNHQWMTLLRFDSPEALDSWFGCDERKQLLQEANQFVSHTEFQKVSTSFPGWFPTDPKTGQPPPNWKTALLVLMGLYPIVMLEIRFLMPLMHGTVPAAPANFIGNLISIALTTWVTVPLSIKAFKFWLFPAEDDGGANLKGSLIVIAALAGEIGVLWNLL